MFHSKCINNIVSCNLNQISLDHFHLNSIQYHVFLSTIWIFFTSRIQRGTLIFHLMIVIWLIDCDLEFIFLCNVFDSFTAHLKKNCSDSFFFSFEYWIIFPGLDFGAWLYRYDILFQFVCNINVTDSFTSNWRIRYCFDISLSFLHLLME